MSITWMEASCLGVNESVMSSRSCTRSQPTTKNVFLDVVTVVMLRAVKFT